MTFLDRGFDCSNLSIVIYADSLEKCSLLVVNRNIKLSDFKLCRKCLVYVRECCRNFRIPSDKPISCFSRVINLFNRCVKFAYQFLVFSTFRHECQCVLNCFVLGIDGNILIRHCCRDAAFIRP